MEFDAEFCGFISFLICFSDDSAEVAADSSSAKGPLPAPRLKRASSEQEKESVSSSVPAGPLSPLPCQYLCLNCTNKSSVTRCCMDLSIVDLINFKMITKKEKSICRESKGWKHQDHKQPWLIICSLSTFSVMNVAWVSVCSAPELNTQFNKVTSCLINTFKARFDASTPHVWSEGPLHLKQMHLFPACSWHVQVSVWGGLWFHTDVYLGNYPLFP